MIVRKSFRLLEAALFLALLWGAVTVVSNVLERKASKIKYAPFLENPQQYDVLFIGDSHVYNGVFPMEMWDDYGIASYNIACYGNTIPVSYWNMMLALDYVKPKLMVIGVKDVEKDYKLTGSSGDVHTALDAFPLSLTKIRAVQDLMSDPWAMDEGGNLFSDTRWEYIFKLGKYHSRWNELEHSDFVYDLNGQKGAGMAVKVAVPNEIEITDVYADELGLGYVYLRKMIEECQSRGIDVLLTQIPFPADKDDQTHGNVVGSIAEEYGVNYINFVSLDHVADYSVDCYDPDSHLNPSGARKTTDYLGRYIMDHYDIPDRRGEAQYSGWQKEFDDYVSHKLQFLCGQEGNLKNLLMLLHDDDFSTAIAVRKGAALYDDDTLMNLMHNIPREHVYEEDDYSKWSGGIFPLDGLEEAYWDAESYLMVVDRKRAETKEYVGTEPVRHDASFGVLSVNGEKTAWTLMRNGESSTFFESKDDDWTVRLLVIDDRNAKAYALQF